jgi:tetratricopeptide (TPR) repeat protein
MVAEEIPDEADGGRRLPIAIAGPIINSFSDSTLRKMNTLLENHFDNQTTTDRDNKSIPNLTEIGIVFQKTWRSTDLTLIDISLLQHCRNSLLFCTNLRTSLKRLLSIAPLSDDIAQGVAERLRVIDRIEDGWAHDEEVVAFFTRISTAPAIYLRMQRAVAFYQLGHCYFSVGQDDLAAAALESAIELDGSYHNAYSLLGVVYDLNGQHDRAIAALQEAIRIRGSYDFAHFNLGTVFERRGKLLEAARSYLAALRCQASFYEAAYNLSNVLLELHLIRDAVNVAAFTGAMALQLRVEPIFNIANAVASLGDLPRAIKLFRYCLGERQDPRIAYNLGLAYAANRQSKSAIDVIKTAEELAEQQAEDKLLRAARELQSGLKAGKTYNWPDLPQVAPSRATNQKHSVPNSRNCSSFSNGMGSARGPKAFDGPLRRYQRDGRPTSTRAGRPEN